MTDVHDVYVEKRRWRFWPIVLLAMVALLTIGTLIAMIMNIHGSISWPAGDVKFGFWPSTTATTAAAPETIAPPARLATEIAPPAPAPEVQPEGEAQPSQPLSATPPVDSNATEPAENAPQ